MGCNDLLLFSKPWPELSLAKLARLVADLGFHGVELPVRPGYQVEPENIGRDLKKAKRILEEHGLKIGSVAGNVDERTIMALGECGVPILRICVGIDLSIGYKASEIKTRQQFDRLIPALDKAGVAIGVQNHCDHMVGSAIGIMHLIENYQPRHICAVLDMAHCAVDGEPEAMALDIVWPHLRLVNFKSAFHRRMNGPEAEEAIWTVHWTTCHHAGYSWRTMVNLLRQRGYEGDICLPAEYSNEATGGQFMGDAVIPYLKTDVSYIKQLLLECPVPVAHRKTNWKSTGVK